MIIMILKWILMEEVCFKYGNLNKKREANFGGGI